MRGHHEVVAAHAQVAHAHAREVELQGLPARTVVEGHEDADLGAGVEQSLPDRILAQRTRVGADRDAVGDHRPRLAEVRRLVEQRAVVIELVARRGHVRRSRRMWRGLDLRHAREAGHRRRRHVLPGRAVVAREVHQPVVGSRPEDPRLPRRLGQGVDRRIPLGAGHVAAHRPARALHRLEVVQREVGGDLLPALPLVARAPDVLARHEQCRRIVRREHHRKGPLEALRHVLHRPAVVVAQPDRDVAPLSGALVISREVAHVATAVRDVVVARVNGDVGIFAAGHRPPVALRDRPIVGPAGDRHRAVVLLRTVQPVRELAVREHMIELRRRLVVDAAPRGAPVETHRAAAVVGIDQPIAVGRRHPHLVGIAVRHAHHAERLAAVDRAVHLQVHHVDDVGVGRVGGDRGVIERPDDKFLVAVGALPGGAAVVTAKDAARRVGGLDVGVDALGVRGAHGDADLADHAARHAGIERQFGPAVPAVGGLPEAAAPRAGVQAPGQALEFPHAREQDARVRGVDAQVGRAGAVVQEQHAFPRRPAIGRAKDAPLAVGPEGVTERRYPGAIGVLAVDADRGDLARFGQAKRLPALAAVGGAVDAGTIGDVLPWLPLAGADPDDIRVARRHGNRPDARDVGHAIRDVLPTRAGIGRFPDAAVDRAKVEDERTRRVSGHGDRPAAAEGADQPPAQRLEGAIGARAVGIDRRVVDGTGRRRRPGGALGAGGHR